MDWPCRHCEDGDRCECSCHWDNEDEEEDELSWDEEDSTRAGALCAAALADTPEPWEAAACKAWDDHLANTPEPEGGE